MLVGIGLPGKPAFGSAVLGSARRNTPWKGRFSQRRSAKCSWWAAYVRFRTQGGGRADRVRSNDKKNKPLSGSRRHAAVERLSLFGNVTRLGPYGLISYAKWFSEAAGSTTAPADAPNFPLVRTFLAARAVELALKAFLALKGRSLLELADGPYGHDLIGLIREAEKLDLKAHVRLNAVQHAEIIKARARASPPPCEDGRYRRSRSRGLSPPDEFQYLPAKLPTMRGETFLQTAGGGDARARRLHNRSRGTR
jgi:hypothetical protein